MQEVVPPRIDTLVLEGGGCYGVTLVGVVGDLESRHVLSGITTFAGTSVGAVVSCLLACRASARFLEDLFMSTYLPQLADYSWNPIRTMYRMFWRFGICAGEALRDFLGQALLRLTGNADITFAEVKQRFGNNLVLVAASLHTEQAVVISHKTHPDLSIRDAARMSSSIPFFYTSCELDQETVVDGGIAMNLPFSAVYHDLDTGEPKDPSSLLGVKFISDLSLKPRFTGRIWTPVGFGMAVLETVYNRGLDYTFHAGNAWSERTIAVPTGNVSILDFWISDSQKWGLIWAGRAASESFFSGQNLSTYATAKLTNPNR